MTKTTDISQRGQFSGDNIQLYNSISALLDLNDDGAVSHPVPGMAVSLLEAARQRLLEQHLAIVKLQGERNTPETLNFIEGVKREADHQRSRWGAHHDAGKTPFDWFWLIGYLAQKAADAAVRGDAEKAKHHTISTAAALANWHFALAGENTQMRPGIDPPRGVE